MNKKWVRLLPLALIIIAVLLGLDQWAIYTRQREIGGLIGMIVAGIALFCGIAGYFLALRSTKTDE